MQRWLWQITCDVWAVGKGIAMVATPTILLLTHVWYEYRITELGYDLSEATQRHEELVDEHRELTVEATLLQQHDRGRHPIRRRYGLERIDPEQVVTIEEPTHSTRASSGTQDDGDAE
jgi:cell division protein FtsL